MKELFNKKTLILLFLLSIAGLFIFPLISFAMLAVLVILLFMRVFYFAIISKKEAHLSYENMQMYEKWLKRMHIALVLIAIFMLVQLDPLRRSPETIRASILRETPIGATTDDVINVINSRIRWDSISGEVNPRGMQPRHLNRTSPFYYLAHIPGPAFSVSIGEQMLGTTLGRYSHFLIIRMLVEAICVFDADGYLIDVSIQKEWLK
jgi:hypothetical protein